MEQIMEFNDTKICGQHQKKKEEKFSSFGGR